MIPMERKESGRQLGNANAGIPQAKALPSVKVSCYLQSPGAELKFDGDIQVAYTENMSVKQLIEKSAQKIEVEPSTVLKVLEATSQREVVEVKVGSSYIMIVADGNVDAHAVQVNHSGVAAAPMLSIMWWMSDDVLSDDVVDDPNMLIEPFSPQYVITYLIEKKYSIEAAERIAELAMIQSAAFHSHEDISAFADKIFPRPKNIMPKVAIGRMENANNELPRQQHLHQRDYGRRFVPRARIEEVLKGHQIPPDIIDRVLLKEYESINDALIEAYELLDAIQIQQNKKYEESDNDDDGDHSDLQVRKPPPPPPINKEVMWMELERLQYPVSVLCKIIDCGNFYSMEGVIEWAEEQLQFEGKLPADQLNQAIVQPPQRYFDIEEGDDAKDHVINIVAPPQIPKAAMRNIAENGNIDLRQKNNGNGDMMIQRNFLHHAVKEDSFVVPLVIEDEYKDPGGDMVAAKKENGHKKKTASPATRNRQSNHSKVKRHVFVDFASVLKGTYSTDKNKANNIKIDVLQFAQFLSQDTSGRKIVTGNYPNRDSHLWKLWKQANYSIVYPFLKESGADVILQSMNDIINQAEASNSIHDVMVLVVSGNESNQTLRKIVKAAINNEWTVEMWCWKSATPQLPGFGRHLKTQFIDYHLEEFRFVSSHNSPLVVASKVRSPRVAGLQVHNENLIPQKQQPEENIPDEYLCSITMEIMNDPVFCADGHTYEREAIEDWLRTQDTSPKTGLPLQHKHLVSNFALKSLIANYKEKSKKL